MTHVVLTYILVQSSSPYAPSIFSTPSPHPLHTLSSSSLPILPVFFPFSSSFRSLLLIFSSSSAHPVHTLFILLILSSSSPHPIRILFSSYFHHILILSAIYSILRFFRKYRHSFKYTNIIINNSMLYV